MNTSLKKEEKIMDTNLDGIYIGDENRRYYSYNDIIDGVIFGKSIFSKRKYKLLCNLYDKLHSFFKEIEKEEDLIKVMEPICINEENCIFPSIFLMSNTKALLNFGCNRAPELVIEIAGCFIDSVCYYEKLCKYRDIGVEKYVIIDILTERITVYEFDNYPYPIQYDFNSEITIKICGSNLDLSINQLLYKEINGKGIFSNKKYISEYINILPYELGTELIDGEIYYNEGYSDNHEKIRENIISGIKSAIINNNRNYEIGYNRVPIITESDFIYTDILVVKESSKIKGGKLKLGVPDFYCEEVPEFVIELSEGKYGHNDYTVRLDKYKELGVKEYWVVDCETFYVDIYNFDLSDKPETGYLHDIIKSRVLDLEIKVLLE